MASRHYLASQHLWSALHNARLCGELETQYVGKEFFNMEHRATVITAVPEAVAFLEALVNEAFQDAADTAKGVVNERIGPLGDQCIGLMKEFWRDTKNGERYVSVLGKYQMALLFADKFKFDPGANPYQDAQLLIDIRNDLIHFRPAWGTHGEEGKLERKAMNKFASNALMSGTGNPWFPEKCLGAGCAEWACATSRNLADKWTDRLHLPRSYEADLNNFPTP